MKATDFSSLHSATLRLLAVMLFPLLTSVSYSQTMIYRQTFGSTGGQTTLASQGITDWTEVYTKDGSSAATTNLYPLASLHPGDANIGAATGTASAYYQGAYGAYAVNYAWSSNKVATSLYTTALNLDPTLNTYTFQWYQNASTTAVGSTRTLLQVGGTWYVSNASYQTAVSTPTLESFTYDPTASNWLVLSTGAQAVNAGVANSSGAFTLTTAASSNLSGNITAVGLLILAPYDSNNSYVIVDSFSVLSSPIPEPASVTLVACCVTGFAWLSLRRKRS